MKTGGETALCSAEGASKSANLSGKRTPVGRTSGECSIWSHQRRQHFWKLSGL